MLILRHIVSHRRIAMILAVSSAAFLFARSARGQGVTDPIRVTISDVSPRSSNEINSTQGPAGRIISLALAADGLRMYAGTWGGGLWRSDDGGAHWHQITSAQPADTVLPSCGDVGSPTRLGTMTIDSVAVSPQDPDLVFVGTGNDRENCNGVYRSGDGGTTWLRVFSMPTNDCPGGSAYGFGTDASEPFAFGAGPEVTVSFVAPVQPVTEVAFAPDDPTKLWAVSGCVVAYSTVLGASPASLTASSSSTLIGLHWTASTIPMAQVSHIAVGSFNPQYQRDRLGRGVWACSAAQIWSSVDGGQNYTPVPASALVNLPFKCNGENALHSSESSAEHQMAADDSGFSPQVYLVSPKPNRQHQLSPPNIHPCPDGVCLGIVQIRRVDSAAGAASFVANLLPGPPAMPDARGSGEISLSGSFSDGSLYLFFSNDEDFFFTKAPPVSEAFWHRLTGIDADDGCSIGSCEPGRDWDPRDLGSPPTRLHDDAHAFALVPGTTLDFGPVRTMSSGLRTCQPSHPNGPTMALGNDGGVAVSPDCGRTWKYGDISTVAASDLAGLSKSGHRPALYFGSRDDGSWFSSDGGRTWQDGTGCGDCLGYFTTAIENPSTVITIARFNSVGGQDFQACCRWLVWHSTDGNYPDPSSPPTFAFEYTPYPDFPRLSTNRGYAPLIQPVLHEQIPDLASTTYVAAVPNDPGSKLSAYSGFVVHRADLKRGGNPFGSRLDRADGRIGDLPTNLAYPFVQTSGGVTRTTFYAAGELSPTAAAWPPGSFVFDWGWTANAETDSVYRADPPSAGSPYTWTCIVPSGPGCMVPATPCPASAACHAYKLAVDPYADSSSPLALTQGNQLLYIADEGGAIKESLDSGRTWFTNSSLTLWLTDQNRLVNAPHCQWNCSWGDSDEELHSFLFLPDEPGTAFAVGIEGVFMTLDAGCAQTRSSTNCASRNGETWHRILDSAATPCVANGLFFDGHEDDGRALYVSCSQRGILKILGIPQPSAQPQLDALPSPLMVAKELSLQRQGSGFPPQPKLLTPTPPEIPLHLPNPPLGALPLLGKKDVTSPNQPPSILAPPGSTILVPDQAFSGGVITGVVLGPDDQPLANTPVLLAGGGVPGVLSGEVVGDQPKQESPAQPTQKPEGPVAQANPGAQPEPAAPAKPSAQPQVATLPPFVTCGTSNLPGSGGIAQTPASAAPENQSPGSLLTDALGRFALCVLPGVQNVVVNLPPPPGSASNVSSNIPVIQEAGQPVPQPPIPQPPEFLQPDQKFTLSGIFPTGSFEQNGKQGNVPVATAISANGTQSITTFKTPHDLQLGLVNWTLTDRAGKQAKFAGGVFKIVSASIDRSKLRSNQIADFEFDVMVEPQSIPNGLCVDTKLAGPVFMVQAPPAQVPVDASGRGKITGKIRATQVMAGSTVPFNIETNFHACHR